MSSFFIQFFIVNLQVTGPSNLMQGNAKALLVFILFLLGVGSVYYSSFGVGGNIRGNVLKDNAAPSAGALADVGSLTPHQLSELHASLAR